jgi:hypothetical protein
MAAWRHERDAAANRMRACRGWFAPDAQHSSAGGSPQRNGKIHQTETSKTWKAKALVVAARMQHGDDDQIGVRVEPPVRLLTGCLNGGFGCGRHVCRCLRGADQRAKMAAARERPQMLEADAGKPETSSSVKIFWLDRIFCASEYGRTSV